MVGTSNGLSVLDRLRLVDGSQGRSLIDHCGRDATAL